MESLQKICKYRTIKLLLLNNLRVRGGAQGESGKALGLNEMEGQVPKPAGRRRGETFK